MLKSHKMPAWAKIPGALVFIFTLLSALMITTGAAVTTRTGNISDTLFEFEADGMSIIAVDTEYRAKLDYTSCYAYNMKSATDIAKAYIKGTDSLPYVTEKACTYGTPKNLPLGAAYYFPNTVKEQGLNYARLQFHPVNGDDCYLYIWWSPDCV